jgi:DNA-binding transcriptional MocR family regulator
MRLSFGGAKAQDIHEGIKRLGDVLKRILGMKSKSYSAY